jgi:hypothetical protein
LRNRVVINWQRDENLRARLNETAVGDAVHAYQFFHTAAGARRNA